MRMMWGEIDEQTHQNFSAKIWGKSGMTMAYLPMLDLPVYYYKSLNAKDTHNLSIKT